MTEVLALSNEQLILKINACINATVDAIRLAADCLKVLDDRQADVSALDDRLLTFFRRVYGGQLLPELWLTCRDSPIYEQAKASSLEVQKRIADNEPIRVVVSKEAGTFDSYLCPPRNMPRAVVDQIMVAGRIKNDAEQIAWLRTRQTTFSLQKEKVEPLPFYKTSTLIRFRRGCEMSKQEFCRMADEWRRK